MRLPICGRCGGYYYRTDVGCPCLERHQYFMERYRSASVLPERAIMTDDPILKKKMIERILKSQKIGEYLVYKASCPRMNEILFHLRQSEPRPSSSLTPPMTPVTTCHHQTVLPHQDLTVNGEVGILILPKPLCQKLSRNFERFPFTVTDKKVSGPFCLVGNRLLHHELNYSLNVWWSTNYFQKVSWSTGHFDHYKRRMIWILVIDIDDSSFPENLALHLESFLQSLGDGMFILVVGVVNQDVLKNDSSFDSVARNLIALQWLGNVIADNSSDVVLRVTLLLESCNDREIQELAINALENYLLFHHDSRHVLSSSLFQDSPFVKHRNFLKMVSQEQQRQRIVISRHRHDELDFWSFIHVCVTTLDELLCVDEANNFLESVLERFLLRMMQCFTVGYLNELSLPVTCVFLAKENIRRRILKFLGEDILLDILRHLIQQTRHSFLLKIATQVLAVRYPEMFEKLEDLIYLKLLQLGYVID